MNVPLSEPDITSSEIDAVTRVLLGSRLSLGPQLAAFERAIADRAGRAHGVAVSSGTAGLHLCIRAMGIGPGDEVIVPSFTFIAAANAIRFEGAVPVFVDIDADTLNMNPECVAAAITHRTRAIMAVHTFGLPAQMAAIAAIAEKHGLPIIEDACEAIGAEIAGRPVGSFGKVAVFAFYPNKQITTGEGGVIVTDDAELADAFRALRNQGRFESDAWHQHSVLGYNYRMSDISAALGSVQAQRLDEILAKRATVAENYDEALQGLAGLTLPPRASAPDRMSWFVYVVRLARDRDRVAQMLQERGVQTGRYFAPIHEQPAYSGWPLPHNLPVTEAESRRTLALPFFNNLTHEQIGYVAECLRKAIL